MLTWFDFLVSIVIILGYLWIWWLYRRSLRDSDTRMTQEAGQDLLDMMSRLNLENRQWERKYSRLEQDYGAALQKLDAQEKSLARRTQALKQCQELLQAKQGIEDTNL